MMKYSSEGRSRDASSSSQTTLEKFATEKREAPDLVRSKKMGVLEVWLKKRFRVEKTKMLYRIALLNYLKSVYGEDQYNSSHKVAEGIDRYLSEQRNFMEDFNNFLLWLNSKKFRATNIHGTAYMTKKFFTRHGQKISDGEWDDMKTLLPPNVTATQDDILTKEQFRAVLNHLPVNAKALVLFLTSTGGRVGEILKLKITDLNLEANPPSVNIRPEYTKKGVGGRVMWFSYEARDMLKEWLRIKDSRLKPRVGEPFPKDMVFGFSYSGFVGMWHRTLERAGLDKKDPTTGVRIYHIHTLRKFFSTKMSEAGVQESVVHAWMGHKGYLDSAYKRYGRKALAEMYLNHMAAVSICRPDEETKQSQVIITENELTDYLAAGWMFKATLPSGKIVVEGKPGMLKPTTLEEPEKEMAVPQSGKPSLPEGKRRDSYIA